MTGELACESWSKRLLAMAPQARRPLVGLVVIGLLITVTYVAQGILIARVLAEIFTGGALGSILGQLAAIVLLQAARAWLLATREARAPGISGAVKAAVRERLTAKLFQLGPGALQRTRTGSMQSTAVDAVEQLDPLVGRFLPQVAVSACLLLLASLALAACGGGDEGASTSGAPTSSAPAQTDSDHYPVTIENCGREVTFNEAPSRAVITFHPYVETFVGLGLGDRAVGRSVYRGVLSDFPILASQAAAFERIPVISETSGPPPKEQLLALRPDFILAYGDFDFEGQGRATRGQLKDAGVNSYQVVCPDERQGIADTYRTILDLGSIFNVRERAEQRVAEIKAQIAEVRGKVSQRLPVTVLVSNSSTRGPIEVAGQGIITEILEAAGAKNVFDDEPTTYLDASLETIANRPVDVFVIASTKPIDDPATEAANFMYETFPNMPASKNRRAIPFSYSYTEPGGWRNAEAVELLARQLHSDAF